MNDNKRVIIRLIGETGVDDRILETLNRFHFRTIYISKENGAGHQLLCAPEVAEGSAGLFMPTGSKAGEIAARRAEKGLPSLNKDYLTGFSNSFKAYLDSPGKVDNRKGKTRGAEPVADICADEFEDEIISALGIIKEPDQSCFGVIMTSDVDYVGKYRRADITSAVVFFINALRTIGHMETAKYYADAALRFLLGRVEYYGFDKILSIANELSFTPVFLLFARLDGGNGLTYLEKALGLNPNYELDSGIMSRAIGAIKEHGGEIGIHGSFKSANNAELFMAEKRRLEEISGVKCVSSRQHFLKSYGLVSAQMYHQAGIGLDITCGYVYSNGYLCGTSRPFYSFYSASEGHGVICVPMVFMDAVPLYFAPESMEETRQEIHRFLMEAQKRCGCVSFNFHQRMVNCFPEYEALYREIAETTLEMGGVLVSSKDMDALYPIPLAGQ
jgi:hypothetical protein